VIDVQSTLSKTTVIDGFTITNGNGGISTLLSSVAIQDSEIMYNGDTYCGGGVSIDHSFVTMTNSLVAHNTAVVDGAICIISTSEVTINGSTIADNHATQERNGILCSLSWCTFVNSIVWGHEGEDFVGDPSRYNVTYSDIEMCFPGEGNICEDPRFVDPARGDYHLRSDSPCIDKGTNANALQRDFDGDRRPFDGDGDGSAVVDMGADEVTLSYNPDRLPAHRPDLDWDRDVDAADIMIVAGAWGAERGESRYRQYYDLYHDGRINIVDVMRVASRWGETFDLGPHFPLNYSPYQPGQAPGGPTPSPMEIGNDIEIVEQETRLIRTYGACPTELAIIPRIANNHGIHVYQGVELTSTPSSNDQEMACFATLVAQHQNIAAGVIGNETLLFGHLSEPDLICYLNQAKETGNVPVTTGESWGVWCNEIEAKPRCQGRMPLGEAVDFILAHSYPYWENVPIEHGAAHVVATYLTLRVVYPDRVVVIGETGWPTCGEARDNAVPSLENQRTFIEELWRWSNLYHFPVLYFEAFDEDWKVAEPGGVGRCWGLYYADRTPKHDNLDRSIPTPEPTPTTPAVRIEHPRDITTTVTKPNCAVPIFGRVYHAESGWHVKVEVFTNQWYIQDKWYPDGLAPVIDGMWSMPEVFLAGQGGFNNHSIRATLVDETGTSVASDEVTGIVRTNPCSP
jgi:exo-beta-1,3-glucanase (GH17 family)